MSVKLNRASLQQETKWPVQRAVVTTRQDDGDWTVVKRKKPRPSTPRARGKPTWWKGAKAKWIQEQVATRDLVDNMMDNCSCEQEVVDMLSVAFDDH